MPPAGGDLKVTHTNWGTGGIKYNKLDAGDKEPEPPVDPDKIVVEAEDLELSGGYYVEHRSDGASGDALIRTCGTGYAKLKDFKGESCPYDIELTVIDENDGAGFIDIFVDGTFVYCIRLDENDGGNGANGHSTYKTITVEDIYIPQGATVTFKGRQKDGEYVRIDKIAFCKDKPEFRECDDPAAVKLDFEGFSKGTVIDDEYASFGVTIEAQRDRDNTPQNDAMIFDSADPTGGDTDLATATQGNILIVSEDNDSSDPDDAIGGTITFTFDNPSKVYDIKVVDTEEGGTITATLADGSLVTFDIPKIPDGAIDQVLIDLDDVVSLEIDLDGSGAIDDLCFVPGTPEPGSLSGRYFCDENRNDVDDAEPGIAGVLVELLDAAGNGTGITTTTGPDGSYSFTGLAPGTYGVKFTDTVSGKQLVDPNVGSDDSIDSDAIDLGGGMSQILDIVVVAGADTPDNDAGVEDIPGALSGTYFCDENRNDIDDGAASGDKDVEGKLVTLLNADGSAAVDIDGNAIAPVRTDAQGDYRFDNLAAGEYVVMFESSVAEGKSFVAPDAGSDDTVDSDVVDIANGKTAPVTVEAGKETKDVDAGVEVLPGALSGRYFCDENDNAVDDGGAEPGVAGKTVMLLEADGVTPATDIDGNPVPATLTSPDGGGYRFDNLAPRSYVVMFQDDIANGKVFVAPDEGSDDTIDSDVDPLTGKTAPVEVFAGMETMDVDAGVVEPNEPPRAEDDEAAVCALETVGIDVLSNDADPEGDTIFVAHIEGVEVMSGESVTLASGATVKLEADGTLTYDSSTATYDVGGEMVAAADLLIGEAAMESFEYSISDGEGTGTATVDVKICGAKNTLETIEASLPDQIFFNVEAFDPATFPDLYTATLSGSGDARLDGLVIEAAYCLDADLTLLREVDILADVYLGTEDGVAGSSLGAGIVEDLDVINWIINQDFGSMDNGDGTGETYTDAEIQGASWNFTNDFVFVGSGGGTNANAQEIVDMALASPDAEGFVPGEGDLVTLVLDPVLPNPDGHEQPFIVAGDFDSLKEDCIC